MTTRTTNRRFLVIGFVGVLCLVAVQTSLYPSVLPLTRYEWAKTLSTGGISALVSSSSISSRSLGASEASRSLQYRAYPFHFSCPAQNPADSHSYHNLTLNRPYDVAIVYHVKLVNNWRDILHDQLITVIHCGLGNAVASRLLLSVCARDAEAGEADGIDELKRTVGQYIPQFGSSIQVDFIERKDCNDNLLGLPAAQSYCSSVSHSTDHHHVVFHLHNGGASEYQPDWNVHKKASDEGRYSRSLYWRKYAEFFVIERPIDCLKAIVNEGALSCGVNLRTQRSDAKMDDNIGNVTQPLAYAEAIWAASCPLVMPTRSGNVSKKRHRELHRTKKDRTKRLIHQEEYDAGTTNPRFKLTCPYFEADRRQNADLILAYHIGFLNNWREVVADQLSTLAVCGLGAALQSMIISHSNATQDNLAELRSVLSEHQLRASVQFVESESMPYEGPIMNAMRDKCQSTRLKRKTIVFYLHNKGVSRYRTDWNTRGDIDKPSPDWKKTPYGFLLYWRKYLEHFTIERPQLCIDAILNGAWACGVNMRPSHYSGNMFVADCDYVRGLSPVMGTGYLDAEAFVGQRMSKATFMEGRFVNLHEAPPAGKAGYRHLMLPEEYNLRAALPSL